MKSYLKKITMAFAAIMTIGSFVLASCDKTDEIMPQNQVTAGTDAQYTKDVAPTTPEAWFIIDQWWTDSQGQLWHVKGSGTFQSANKVCLKIKFNMPNGTIGTFDGTAEWMLPNDSCVIESAYKVTPEVKAFIREFSWYLLY